MTDSEQQPWGRVDETGTVFVRTNEGERAVGQYPDGSAEEAMAYFERKYADLAGQVTLLEQRVRRGAPATDVAKAVTKLRESVAEAKAVGGGIAAGAVVYGAVVWAMRLPEARQLRTILPGRLGGG